MSTIIHYSNKLRLRSARYELNNLLRSMLLTSLCFALVTNILGFDVGNRVKATGDINVRTAPPQLAAIGTFPQQNGGVHGTIKSASRTGTAGGFTGNWWEIDWDAGTDGWCAESVIVLAPSAGDVSQPNFSSQHYKSDNIFWLGGFAPASTSPPNPQLGNALGNCTWYAHGRLREMGYSATQLNALHGNAEEWDNAANANGIAVINTPNVHSIAQSNTQNHVAVVESVNADGTITVTESSYVGNNPSPNSVWNVLWRHRTVSKSWFDNFIHVTSGDDVVVAPVITAPGGTDSPGPELATLTPRFEWAAATGATGYGLYIRDVTTDTLVFANDGGAKTGTSFDLPAGVLAAGHSFRWAMTSFSAAGETQQSPYRYFTTREDDIVVVAPVITGITLNAEMLGLTVTGPKGGRILLQESLDFVTWLPVSTGVISAEGLVQFAFPKGPENLSFFRVVSQDQAPVELQPGPSDGKDIWTTSVYSYAPGGAGPGGGKNSDTLRVGGWADEYYSLLQFDLSGLPAVAESAVLNLYCYNQSGGSTAMYLDRITQEWDWRTQGTGRDRDRLWWADRPPASQWNIEQVPVPVTGQWYSVDITSLYNSWQSAEHPNCGLQFRPVNFSGNNFNEFYSADYESDPSLRPKLVVTP